MSKLGVNRRARRMVEAAGVEPDDLPEIFNYNSVLIFEGDT